MSSTFKTLKRINRKGVFNQLVQSVGTVTTGMMALSFNPDSKNVVVLGHDTDPDKEYFTDYLSPYVYDAVAFYGIAKGFMQILEGIANLEKKENSPRIQIIAGLASIVAACLYELQNVLQIQWHFGILALALAVNSLIISHIEKVKDDHRRGKAITAAKDKKALTDAKGEGELPSPATANRNAMVANIFEAFSYGFFIPGLGQQLARPALIASGVISTIATIQKGRRV